jgi:hypothetical protein
MEPKKGTPTTTNSQTPNDSTTAYASPDGPSELQSWYADSSNSSSTSISESSTLKANKPEASSTMAGPSHAQRPISPSSPRSILRRPSIGGQSITTSASRPMSPASPTGGPVRRVSFSEHSQVRYIPSSDAGASAPSRRPSITAQDVIYEPEDVRPEMWRHESSQPAYSSHSYTTPNYANPSSPTTYTPAYSAYNTPTYTHTAPPAPAAPNTPSAYSYNWGNYASKEASRPQYGTGLSYTQDELRKYNELCREKIATGQQCPSFEDFLRAHRQGQSS